MRKVFYNIHPSTHQFICPSVCPPIHVPTMHLTVLYSRWHAGLSHVGYHNAEAPKQSGRQNSCYD